MNEEQKMFNPQYLKELRIQHRNKLDEGLIESTKQKILEANLAGADGIELSFRVNSSWEKLIKHFEELGFYVSSADYVSKQYDIEGKQVYYFNFSWNIEEE
jgi:hypothetical protein